MEWMQVGRKTSWILQMLNATKNVRKAAESKLAKQEVCRTAIRSLIFEHSLQRVSNRIPITAAAANCDLLWPIIVKNALLLDLDNHFYKIWFHFNMDDVEVKMNLARLKNIGQPQPISFFCFQFPVQYYSPVTQLKSFSIHSNAPNYPYLFLILGGVHKCSI